METSCGGGIHALGDDALAHILVLLPSVSVLRCRAVCKDWRRVTSDRSFLVAHAARRPLEMVAEFCVTGRWEVKATPLDPEQRRDRFLCSYAPAPFADLSRGVLYSLHGLLVLMQRWGLFVICNPATRQWTNLPDMGEQSYRSVFGCGFYFHASSGEYRLLCHAIKRGKEEYCLNTYSITRQRHYYILSAGSIMPRRLGPAPSNPSGTNPDYKGPVTHRGNLHWLSTHPYDIHAGKMLSFDTACETFQLMSRPPLDDTVMASLFELDGELCVAAMPQSLTSLHVWVLKDYKTETWTLRHRVDVPLPKFRYSQKPKVSKVISVGSGAILMGAPNCEVARMYHLKEKRVICRDFVFRYAISPKFFVFNESLVPHTFFDSPRCPDLETIRFTNES